MKKINALSALVVFCSVALTQAQTGSNTSPDSTGTTYTENLNPNYPATHSRGRVMKMRRMTSQTADGMETRDRYYNSSGSYDSGSDNLGCASTDTACLHDVRQNNSY